MADSTLYSFTSPLAGWEDAPPLPEKLNADRKSFYNEPSEKLSVAYEKFPDPVRGGDGFDAHIYFDQNDPGQVKFATELWERIRREFPELRIYKLWHKAIGPHTQGMFEVSILTPTQFGAFVSWLVINRGPLSVLVHPNSDDQLRDHTQRATWLGKEIPINTEILRQYKH